MEYIKSFVAFVNSIYTELVATTSYNTACAVLLGTVFLFVTAATLTVAKVIPVLIKRVTTINRKAVEEKGGT